LKILALITARGGSKRIPAKNLRKLGHRPLVVWSVDVIKGIAEICDILVSTDDPAIAEIARKAGALVPWLRPGELSTDTASSIDVCLHAIDWYETQKRQLDGLLLLQPTSPFRSRDSIIRGIDLFRTNDRNPVLGVSPAVSHPMWCYEIRQRKLYPFIDGADSSLRSQDLPPAYVINGAFYLIAPSDLRKSRSFITEDAVPLVIEDPREGIDIDSEWDWQMAEGILATKSAYSK
jgi:CMP-N,N'-diacetyllegionaminic acid synthase